MTLDELEEYGVERMDEEKIRSFLSNQGVGVLGLPTQQLPYMIPISYGFDGQEDLYFTYVVGEESQKALVSEETKQAGFLVFDAPSETLWTSVAMEGTLTRVPDHEIDSIESSLESNWRPEALERASESEETQVYRFRIENKTGIRHSGIPSRMNPE